LVSLVASSGALIAADKAPPRLVATDAADAAGDEAQAGDAVPEGNARGWPEKVEPLPETWRGTGGGLSMIPLVFWWLVILAWTSTVDWIGRDATKREIRPAFWGTVCGLPLPLAALVAWWIPWSAVGIVIMVLAWLVPIGIYAAYRNPKVAPNEQILTYGHARRLVADVFMNFGVDIGEPMDEADVLPDLKLTAMGGQDAAENEARVEAAVAMPGLEEARKLLLVAIVARATTLVIELGENMTVRQEVDGVWSKPRVRQPPRSRKQKEAWVEAPGSSRAVGESVSQALKTLVGLAAKAPGGTGPFLISVDGKPRNARLIVRRSSTVEQLTITIEAPAVTFRKLTDLGMDAAVTERLAELLAADRGVLLLSSPSGGGLTATFDLAVETADRLLRDFVSIEDAANPPREIQNVKPLRFDARTGVTPVAALAEAMREYPRVIVTRDVRDKDLVVELVRLAAEGRLVIMSLKAADAADAVARILGCGVAPRTCAGVLLGSLSQRLVRRLCPKCRVDIPTPPQFLTRLKKTAEELPHIRGPSQVGCRLCCGSGYLGRLAVFELASGVGLRKAIAASATPEEIRKASIADGMRPLKDAAVDVIASGVTSLDEVQRALSAKSAPPSPPPATNQPKKSSSSRTAPPPGPPPARRKSP
jgi:general secretion pathway protein E/type IV pilus assembly protein PilB